MADSGSQVQEAADCLGADCFPRYVGTKQMPELEVEGNPSEEVWVRSEKAWASVLDELSSLSLNEEDGGEANVVVVGHPMLHVALVIRCLRLGEEAMGAFHVDSGSISVIDFPDGPRGRGVVRCVNYTAHLGRWSIPVTRPSTNEDEF